jgi:hypothetical protein
MADLATSRPDPAAARRAGETGDPMDPADLERALKAVPSGALALCGLAVGLMLIAWLYVYFAIFLPRGAIS